MQCLHSIGKSLCTCYTVREALARCGCTFRSGRHVSERDKKGRSTAMDRKRMVRSLAALGAGVLLVAAAGCAGGAEPSSSDGSSAPTTTATLPPVLEVELKTLISREDVEAATGKTFGEPQLYDEDTNIHFTAEDKSVVDVHMAEGTREDFDAITTAYGELTDAPNLGEAAKWSEQTGELLVYGKGYLFTVAFRDFPEGTDLLSIGRELAAGILEKLP